MSEQTAVYGYCPKCGSMGQYREKRPNGNDSCYAGHHYPSASALAVAPTPSLPSEDWREYLELKFEEQFAKRHPNKSLLRLRAGHYQDPHTHDAWVMFRDGAISMAQFNRALLDKFNKELPSD